MGKPGILKSLQMLAATLKSSEVESSAAHLAGGLVKWPHKCSNFLFRNQLQIKISRQKIYSLEYTQEGCQRYVWEWGVPMSASYNYWFKKKKKDVFTWKQAWLLLSETVRRAIGEAWQQNAPSQGVHCPGNRVVSPAISSWWKSPEKWSRWLWYCEVALREVTQVESRLLAYTHGHWHVHIWTQMHIANWKDSYLPV